MTEVPLLSALMNERHGTQIRSQDEINDAVSSHARRASSDASSP